MMRSGLNGFMMKSSAPRLKHSVTMSSWPIEEHMITLVSGLKFLIFLRASMPSMSGMVTSRMMTAGRSTLWKFRAS